MAAVDRGRRRASWRAASVTRARRPPDVFAVTAEHNLWDHTPPGWTLASSGDLASISGRESSDGEGDVFGVLADGSLWEYNPAFPNPGHWQQREAGGVLAVADAG